MNRALASEIRRLGGDPADEAWAWLATRGPHGPTFTWGQTRLNPAGYTGIEHLREIVDEMGASVPSFRPDVEAVVRAALRSQLPELLRRAIQVAAVVGGDREFERVNFNLKAKVCVPKFKDMLAEIN